MEPLTIFWPVMALIGWTLLVLLLIPWRRFQAAASGRVGLADFRCGESERVPDSVSLPNRVFMNLLEVPVLFYLLCTLAYVTDRVTPAMVLLGWLYLAVRIGHSLIYLTYNHVFHRFLVFALSNLILFCLWLLLGWALLG